MHGRQRRRVTPAGLPDLEIISTTLKGYDNFGVDACTRRGVWLASLPTMLTAPAAELTVGLTIGLLRRHQDGNRYVRNGQYHGWRPILYAAGLAGARIGIVGMGELGQAAAQRLRPFEPARIAHSDPATVPEATAVRLGLNRLLLLTELLATSTVILLLAPLTHQTRHLIDHRTLGLVKPGTDLVNLGRGSVLDERAVADALDAGLLAGYASDVFEMEDWALPDRPNSIPDRLRQHTRTLFNLGSAVNAVHRDMSMAAAAEVERVLSGSSPTTSG